MELDFWEKAISIPQKVVLSFFFNLALPKFSKRS
jgi:hypothetical protein